MRRPEDGLGVPAAEAADRSAHEAPVAHPAAGHVARAEHEVGVPRGGDEALDVRRVVRQVGVHLEHELGAAAQRDVEAGEVGRPEALALRAVQDLDGGELRGEGVGDPPRPVRGVVVDDEDPVRAGGRTLERRECRPHHALDVPGLLVGREDEPHHEAGSRVIACRRV